MSRVFVGSSPSRRFFAIGYPITPMPVARSDQHLVAKSNKGLTSNKPHEPMKATVSSGEEGILYHILLPLKLRSVVLLCEFQRRLKTRRALVLDAGSTCSSASLLRILHGSCRVTLACSTLIGCRSAALQNIRLTRREIFMPSRVPSFCKCCHHTENRLLGRQWNVECYLPWRYHYVFTALSSML